jgi:probable F420-dependent oxidoreductase
VAQPPPPLRIRLNTKVEDAAWKSALNARKEVATILSGCAARTDRIQLGSGVFSATSRLPVLLASTMATLQGLYGSRFVLGLGRGLDEAYQGHGFSMPSYAEMLDRIDIIKRLWRGETVNYSGPAGNYADLRFVDLPEGPAPEVWFAHFGGPRASKAAANPLIDGVILMDLLNPVGTATSVASTRQECERIGRDPAGLRIAQCVVSAPELDDDQTAMYLHGRLVGSLVYSGLGEILVRMNQWDPAITKRVREHPKFTGLNSVASADQKFHLSDLAEVARDVIPEEWIRSAGASGTVDQCLASLQAFKDAGADEIILYGTPPAVNEKLIASWRAGHGR